MLVNTVMKDLNGVSMSAEIHQENGIYEIRYFGPTGLIKTEQYTDKSIYFVTEAAENWASGLKVLNG